MTFAPTWMDLEILILGEVIQRQKDEYHMKPRLCGIYKMM